MQPRIAARLPSFFVATLALFLLGFSSFAVFGEPLPSSPLTTAKPSAEPSARTAEDLYQEAERLFIGVDGKGQDFAKAQEIYTRAAEMGHGLAALRLGFLYAEKHFEGAKTDYVQAEKWFRAAAEQDAGDARFRLGNFYHHYVKPPDYSRAAEWLLKAAEGGHRIAQYDIANLYLLGKGVKKDEKTAMTWMKKSAEQGALQAMMALSDAYRDGRGVAKSSKDSLRWAEKAAAENNSPYWYNRAGDAYFQGLDGGKPFYRAAAVWYEKAAGKGDAHAQARLAKILLEGLAGKKDPERAKALAESAARDGNKEAQSLLKTLKTENNVGQNAQETGAMDAVTP